MYLVLSNLEFDIEVCGQRMLNYLFKNNMLSLVIQAVNEGKHKKLIILSGCKYLNNELLFFGDSCGI